jgi:prevent-host-death family protein
MIRLTATEASRGFSDMLGRVAAGEEIEITRAGSTVARMSPVRPTMLSAERLKVLLGSAPPVDDGFSDDVRQARRDAGLAPGDPWAS